MVLKIPSQNVNFAIQIISLIFPSLMMRAYSFKLTSILDYSLSPAGNATPKWSVHIASAFPRAHHYRLEIDFSTKFALWYP